MARDTGPDPAFPLPGLYPGRVMHARLTAPVHRFNYTSLSVLLDLDDWDSASGASSLFSLDRFNLISVHRRDHGPEDGSCLRAHVDGLMGQAGCIRPERVFLFAFPRVLGYVFNPISLYFCYGPHGGLTDMIYDVRNTFGEKHTYVAPIAPENDRGDRIRQTRAKRFFVSPFLPMDLRYFFRVEKPADAVRYRIFETGPNGPVLSATHTAEHKPLTTWNILTAVARIPFAPHKATAGIHWEALKLFTRGATYHRRGPAPARASFSDLLEDDVAATSPLNSQG
ncbi:MAG: DUF1365 domain-containing protein [Pseudomonadota bacterium]